MEEASEIHAMQSNALEFSANETARPEEPRENPETDSKFPETPGTPDPKWKPRSSLHEIPTVELERPIAGMYSQFCCVRWEWQYLDE